MKKCRVLIEVSGGVAEWFADPGVEVHIIDYDNVQLGQDYTGVLPDSWKDLAPHVAVKYFKAEDQTSLK